MTIHGIITFMNFLWKEFYIISLNTLPPLSVYCAIRYIRKRINLKQNIKEGGKYFVRSERNRNNVA